MNTLTKEAAIAMYNSDNELLKQEALKFYPELEPKIDIPSFDEACKELGISNKIPKGLSPSMQAQYQLEKIIEVVNKGQDIDPMDDNKTRYTPYFCNNSGLFSFAHVRRWSSALSFPAPLLIFSEDKAEQMATVHFELYKQMLTKI